MISQTIRSLIEPKLLAVEDLLWLQSVSAQSIKEHHGAFGAVLRLVGKKPIFKDPIYYAITTQRLLAFFENGNLAQEMKVSDMELFIDLGHKYEFMVSRKNDPESEKGFHFYLPDNLDAAKDILFTQFGLE